MTPDHQTEAARRIVRLLGPHGPELTCEQCFEQLDRYVERELEGAAADEAVPGMRAHLVGCPACDEDHVSLLTFVTSQRTTGR
jgi:hypothetical protein